MLDIGTIWLMHQYRRITLIVFPRTASGDSIVFQPDDTIKLDMAGPSVEPTNELEDAGPVLHLQWKPPLTYAKESSNRPSYRDKGMVRRMDQSNTNRNQGWH
jgi:hypothetical protein